MNLLAIDPGPRTCGVVLLDVDEFPPQVLAHDPAVPVDDVLFALADRKWLGHPFEAVAAERFASQRKPLDNDSIFTIEVSARIWQQCVANVIEYVGIYRREVKRELGLPPTVGNPQVNETLRFTYPATGGPHKRLGRQVGTKKHPGPLYGFSDHTWAALGVGVAWCLRRTRRQRAAELEELKAERQPELFE